MSRRPDSESWIRARRASDPVEDAVARWLIGRGYRVDRSVGERRDYDLRAERRFEVKADLRAPFTKRVALEFEYAGEPSGIFATGADILTMVVGCDAFSGPMRTWRDIASEPRWKRVAAGDDDKARIVLVDEAYLRARSDLLQRVRLDIAPDPR